MPLAATSLRPARPRLQLLGEPCLLLVDGAVLPLERKDAALLALLALDGAIARGRAAALLWPDVDERAARNNLRQRLHRLCRRAGRDLAARASEVLRLADDIEHDLTGLPARLEEEATEGAGELLGALDFADCAELSEWVAAARQQWRAARRNALAGIASRLEDEGHIALALQYAERLVSDDPLQEHAYRRLMRLHYLRGDRAAALTAFARCREALARHLKALPARETVELARLVQASGALPASVPAPGPIALLRAPALVGRDPELRLLEKAWRQRSVALILGEPGIGKTRLSSEFAAARKGVLASGARPGDARVPYALLARLLRAALGRCGSDIEGWVRNELARLLPQLGPAPTEPPDTARLQRAVVSAAAAWRPAGLEAIVVDDLHLADEASLELLLRLAAAPGGGVPRLLFAAREEELRQRLARRRHEALRTDVVEIRLGPLDSGAIAALLQSLALPGFDAHAWAEPLARHTGGNPLFILETLNALLAQEAGPLTDRLAHLPAPGSVGQLIERRLAQLSAPALRLARVAALAGPDFSVDLAAHVLGTHPLDLADAWRELEVAHVIRNDAFAHDLLFEATLRSIPGAIGRVLHREIARWLQGHGAPVARAALHWSDAHAWDAAALAYAAAARSALADARSEEAADHWNAACACFKRAGRRADAFQARGEAVMALLAAARVDGARAAAEELEAAAKTGDEWLQALLALARVHLASGDLGSAAAAARAALDEARRLGASDEAQAARGLLEAGRAAARTDPGADASESEEDRRFPPG